MAIYVCSDIHGQKDLLDAMLKDIDLKDEDQLFVLGDIIDRGPKSIEALMEIMKIPNAICLLGNHELMMLDYMGIMDTTWLLKNNGGQQTLNTFKKKNKKTREAILKYIKSMPIQYELEEGGQKFLLSHSSFIPQMGTVMQEMVSDSDIFKTVWYSPWRFWEYEPTSTYRLDNRIHIVGHVPTDSITEWPNGKRPTFPHVYVDEENRIINIDTGCARIPRKGSEENGLCCMNLTKWAQDHDKSAFKYYH